LIFCFSPLYKLVFFMSCIIGLADWHLSSW